MGANSCVVEYQDLVKHQMVPGLGASSLASGSHTALV
jgi:hypothetical protein